jgi:hypothetical protein
MAIQIGKYKRPGIFIEEFDQSIISSPIVEGITNLVIGVSKKGPVNTPIRISNLGDLEAIFGQLDRNLERKGSFFHRTISKMLETSPVFAMNLLLTDDTLDVIEYKSLSSSAQYNNDIKREGPYRRFFDTTGFWKRDTESFVNLTKNNLGYNERAFSLTNLSDRAITAFVFKSSLTGFDRTLLEWYGSVEKMPTYVSPLDYASDYLVDVVVVGGDWSNYQELAVDPRWSAYFNASGLRKEQIRNFANDRNITLLSYYEGLSLIPYFRDLNGRNIFIETTINRDTDRTGLFCAFNNDLVEADFYNGKVDILGNTVVGVNEVDIDFLSYKETIAEQIEVTAVPLDLPGNVTAMLGGGYGYSLGQPDHTFGSIPTTTGIVVNEDSRTAWFTERAVYGVTEDATITSTTQSYSIQYNVAQNSFAIIGNTYVPISGTTSLTINASDYPILNATASYVATFVLDNTGEISSVTTYTPFSSSLGNYPVVTSSDIVLAYIKFDIAPSTATASVPGAMYNVAKTIVSVDSNGYVDLTFGSSNEFNITPDSSGSIKIEFPGTNTQPKVNNYKQHRQFLMFNRLVNLIDSPNKNKMTMNLGTSASYNKVSLEGITISNIVTITTQNKSFVLSGFGTTDLSDVLNGYFVLYTLDNEFILGSDSVITKNEVATPTEGVVGKYSRFYTRYYDGIINTKDYFYSNRLYVDNSNNTSSLLLGKTFNVSFIDGETNTGNTSSYAGYDYIVFECTDTTIGATQAASALDIYTFEQIIIPDATLNSGSFTIVTNSVDATQTPAELADALGFPGGNYFAYQVNEEVVSETKFGISLVYNYLRKHYLKMYLNNDGKLKVDFLDELLETPETVNIEANNTFFIQSAKSNLKQTIEIEIPNNYVQVPNKILVKGERYTEVKVGDFLEAFVDESTLEFEQVGRKLTRILSKRQYAGDASLTELTCDARIKTYSYDGDLQTMRYVSIDNYVTTYKAIPMKGFRVRNASLPDGTEAKQNSILNLVAKGTPLFKALTNKEAIDFRYLIDAFGLGLIERSKQQLLDICGERLDVFGFINMPSLRQFKNSSSPSFVNTEGVLQVEYITKGGDPNSSPAFFYSFGEGAGTTCVGYFTPYISVNDNGRPLEVPPASFVATTFMRKHISNVTSVTPWTIAAGVTNGRITNITGTEMNFTNSDIEFLNTAQMNPIVFKRNRGYVIETENTGQTLYKSALSYIHVREVLIELERELSRMLLDYQWRYNTPDIRAEIKLRADVICETYVSRNGLFNYFNKMDEENNTPDIIDNQIGVLDTYVEPIKGMGIIVNNITILRTGAISAGGFITS